MTSSCYGVAEIGQCKPVRNPLGNQSSLIESALSKPCGVERGSNHCTRFSANATSSFIDPISIVTSINSNAARILSNAGLVRLHHESEFFT